MPVCDRDRDASDGKEEQVRIEANLEVRDEELEQDEWSSEHECSELKIAEIAVSIHGIRRLRDSHGLADLWRAVDARHAGLLLAVQRVW